MEALFGRDGRVVGWLHPENVIVDGSRRCRAFVQDDGVFNFGGRYLGEFRNGFLRDETGAYVGFVHGAFGGPPKPATTLPPLAPLVRVPRTRHLPRVVPFHTSMCREWSPESFDAFLGGTAW